MIDPKIDQIPVESEQARNATSPEERERLRNVSSNLSVNNTVASNANLSVGGRGVDTSGVAAGAGAGAGLTRVDSTGSTMPEIVDGARSSGTTPLASDDRSAANSQFTHAEVSQRAYRAWCERGCPDGSPEEDWRAAEEDLRTRSSSKSERDISQKASAGGI